MDKKAKSKIYLLGSVNDLLTKFRHLYGGGEYTLQLTTVILQNEAYKSGY
ncbi:MAG: hypothetical protein ABIP10_09085 [Ferruginibacter sp.]